MRIRFPQREWVALSSACPRKNTPTLFDPDKSPIDTGDDSNTLAAGLAVSTETATLALNGDVFLDDYSKAMGYLHGIMKGLSDEVSGKKIDWKVDALESGSAFITLAASSLVPGDHLQKVVRAYAEVGRALQQQTDIPYGPKVSIPAKKLCGLMNGRITSIRFETSESDSEVYSHPPGKKVQRDIIHTLGAVEGRIQSLSNRGGLRFTIYDLDEDRPVSCYLNAGCEDVMRNAWGKIAAVEGMVRRDPLTGKISTVREIPRTGIRLFDSPAKYTWEDAIGCSPAQVGSLSTEEAIQRSRDRAVATQHVRSRAPRKGAAK